MKVAYFIYSHTNGLGGHYRSLKALIQGWENSNVDYIVINVGINPTPVLKDLKNYTFFSSSLFLLPNTFIKIYRILSSEKYHVLHAYDSMSYIFVRTLSMVLHIPALYTKCGGANTAYTPLCKNVILFSQENYEYHQKTNVNAEISLIPNRVVLTSLNTSSTITLKTEFSLERSKVILRIGNINEYYAKSVKSAFELAESYMKINSAAVQLILIGVQLDNTLDLLKTSYPDVSFLLLDTLRYTKNAADFVDIADFIVGTGRGAMEALGRGKVVFIPSSLSTLPVRVTQDNFLAFLAYNFSERHQNISSLSLVQMFDERVESGLKMLFNEHCLASRGNEKVLEIYQKIQTNPKKVFIYKLDDYFANFIKYISVNFPINREIKGKLKEILRT